MLYTSIVIIYNPNSTGPSQEMAKKCRQQILKKIPKQKVELVATKHAGHAETLAYDIAKANKKPLVISSSGDGGYHEVINGLMRAQREGATPTAGLLPAGNANDHHRNRNNGSIIQAIANQNPQIIDLLLLEGKRNGKTIHRYGHSYIGLGLTPKIALQLNKSDLNFFNQIWLVAKGLFTIRSVPLVVNGKRRSYDSVVTSKIQTMSKVMTVGENLKSNDGQMAITMFRRRKRLALIRKLLKASVLSQSEDTLANSLVLRTVNKTLVQIDGELIRLDANTDINITVEKQALACFV